jgi:hypothetical protein
LARYLQSHPQVLLLSPNIDLIAGPNVAVPNFENCLKQAKSLFTDKAKLKVIEIENKQSSVERFEK